MLVDVDACVVITGDSLWGGVWWSLPTLGGWLPLSISVNFAMTLAYSRRVCPVAGTIFLHASRRSAAAVIVWSPSEMAGMLQFVGYSLYVPVVM